MIEKQMMYYFIDLGILLNLKGWHKIVRNNYDKEFNLEIYYNSGLQCETFSYSTIEERDKIYIEIMKQIK